MTTPTIINDAARLAQTELNGSSVSIEIEMFDLGCIIGTHTGPGVIGIIFDGKGE